MTLAFSIYYLYKNNLINDNSIIDIIISDNLGIYRKSPRSPDFMLKYALNIDVDNSEIVIKEEDIKEPEEANELPLVYIYNTHQEEKYKREYLESYNISSSVLLASKILKEYLEDLGIKVIVEEDSVSSKLHSLNWRYGYSYKVSRMFLEKAYKDNPSLKYFIDLHRDSSSYDKTTTTIDGEKYARLLFVVGLDNDNYQPNLKLATELREKIDSFNSGLCRGIMKKSGPKVNGVYNQDFNSKVMLIEVGGQYNNIKEVDNTLKAFAGILKDYIEGDLNEQKK